MPFILPPHQRPTYLFYISNGLLMILSLGLYFEIHLVSSDKFKNDAVLNHLLALLSRVLSLMDVPCASLCRRGPVPHTPHLLFFQETQS